MTAEYCEATLRAQCWLNSFSGYYSQRLDWGWGTALFHIASTMASMQLFWHAVVLYSAVASIGGYILQYSCPIPDSVIVEHVTKPIPRLHENYGAHTCMCLLVALVLRSRLICGLICENQPLPAFQRKWDINVGLLPGLTTTSRQINRSLGLLALHCMASFDGPYHSTGGVWRPIKWLYFG